MKAIEYAAYFAMEAVGIGLEAASKNRGVERLIQTAYAFLDQEGRGLMAAEAYWDTRYFGSPQPHADFTNKILMLVGDNTIERAFAKGISDRINPR